jgi:hypothetical protein
VAVDALGDDRQRDDAHDYSRDARGLDAVLRHRFITLMVFLTTVAARRRTAAACSSP